MLWKVSFDRKGHRVRAQGFKNKSAAQSYFEEAERMISVGKFDEWKESLSKDEMTFDNVFKLWSSSPRKQRKSTLRQYETTYRLYLEPYFKNKPIKAYGNTMYNRFHDWLMKEKEGTNSKLFASGAVLKVLINYAFDRGYVTQIPTVKYVFKKNVKPMLISAEELFEVLEDEMFEELGWRQFRNIVLVQFFTLTRIGETLALKKEDIDFEKKTVSITKALKQHGSVIGPTKNSKTNPEFPMNDALATVLKEQFLLAGDSEWLFPSPEGQIQRRGAKQGKAYPIQYASISMRWVKVCEKLGLPRINSHQVRKAAISHLVNSGCSIKTAEHAARITATMILNVYSGVEKKRFLDEYKSAFEITDNRQGDDNPVIKMIEFKEETND